MATIPLPALHLNPPPQNGGVDLGQIGQLLALRNQMQNAPLQRQALQQQVQSGQLELAQNQQAAKDQQAFRAATQDPSLQGKTIGEVADALAQKGAISESAWQSAKKADTEHMTAIANLNETQLKAAKATHDQTQELYNNVMNLPDDQLAQQWPQIAQQFNAIPGQKQKLDPQQPLAKQQLAQFGPLIAMGNGYLDQELARRKAVTEEKQKEAESQFYQQNGGAPGVSAELQQQADWLKKNPGKGPSDYKLWVMRNSPTAMVMNNQLGGQKNDDALNFAADNYRQTGQLPAGFARSPQTTSAIIQRAAQLDKEAGGQGVAVNKTILNANKTSLDSLQKNFDQVQAFENTALKNMDVLQQTAQNIPDLGTKFANVPVRMITGNMIGTANMAAFKTALNTAQTEAAKVLNSSNASGVLSDSARHELQALVDGNATYPALKASLDVLRTDMKNRHDSYQMQIKDIQGRIGGKQDTSEQTSGLSVTAPNGKTYTFKDQASADAFKQKAGIQ